MIIRHRINHKGLSADEASTRFLESFYPVTPSNSHVLVVSPQVELSPLYFHYLKYTLLEYKYSAYGSLESKNLVGISLNVPTRHLNGSEPFSVPTPKTRVGPGGIDGEVESQIFLWQAPNSDAALYFGEKWVEFHDFLGNRLKTLQSGPVMNGRQHPLRKSVTEMYPSWMEFFLELIRARGYFMLFPGFDTTDAIATVHNELYNPPEEFVESPLEGDLPKEENYSSDPLTVDPAKFAPPLPPVEPSLILQPLVTILPFEGDLPEVHNMPHLSHDGRRISSSDVGVESTAYSESFRRTIGACPIGHVRDVKAMSTADLYCFGYEDADEDGTSEVNINTADAIVGPTQQLKNATNNSAGSSQPTITHEQVEIVPSAYHTQESSAALPQRLPT